MEDTKLELITLVLKERLEVWRLLSKQASARNDTEDAANCDGHCSALSSTIALLEKYTAS